LLCGLETVILNVYKMYATSIPKGALRLWNEP
jgi:hypothetical protein